MEMAVPIREEIIANREIQEIIEEFKVAAKKGILPDDANIVIDRYSIAFISTRGQIKLWCAANCHLEIKTKNYVLTSSQYGFVLSNEMRFAPKLIVGSDAYYVDDFIEFLIRGFRLLLKAYI